MDCNSYSYTPHMLDEGPAPQRQQVNAVTIERKTANGRDYYIILANDGSNKAYTIESAIRTAADYLKHGI